MTRIRIDRATKKPARERKPFSTVNSQRIQSASTTRRQAETVSRTKRAFDSHSSRHQTRRQGDSESLMKATVPRNDEIKAQRCSVLRRQRRTRRAEVERLLLLLLLLREHSTTCSAAGRCWAGSDAVCCRTSRAAGLSCRPCPPAAAAAASSSPRAGAARPRGQRRSGFRRYYHHAGGRSRRRTGALTEEAH